MSKRKIHIDKDNFESLLSFQCTKEDITGFFHCSHDTIERYCKHTYRKTFSEVSEEYRAAGRASLRRTQFAMAQSNVQMAIHLGKQYLGQADKSEADIKANMKHGVISKLIVYDPVTGKPTEETINGAEEDVRAYLRDNENYNGEILAFSLPKKDPAPDDSDIKVITDNAVLEDYDDGRGGYL